MTSKLAPVQVCFALDAGFRDCTLVAITSVLEQSHGPVRLAILTVGQFPGFSDQINALVKTHPDATVEFHTLAEEDFDFPVHGLVTSASYARLKFPSLLRGRWLYLDGDVIVTKPLDPLFEADLKGAPIAAARDLHMQKEFVAAKRRFRKKRGDMTKMSKLYQKLMSASQHLSVAHYFNSGVLLMDMEVLRTHPRIADIQDIPKAHKAKHSLGFPQHDQDWLNYHLSKEAYRLSHRWNVMPSIHLPKYREFLPFHVRLRAHLAQRNPSIIHFAGQKPWDPEVRAIPRFEPWIAQFDAVRTRCANILSQAGLPEPF